jgi:hypothetical protein
MGRRGLSLSRRRDAGQQNRRSEKIETLAKNLSQNDLRQVSFFDVGIVVLEYKDYLYSIDIKKI